MAIGYTDGEMHDACEALDWLLDEIAKCKAFSQQRHRIGRQQLDTLRREVTCKCKAVASKEVQQNALVVTSTVEQVEGADQHGVFLQDLAARLGDETRNEVMPYKCEDCGEEAEACVFVRQLSATTFGDVVFFWSSVP